MNTTLIRALAGASVFAAGLASAQVYSPYPTYGYGYGTTTAAGLVRCESTDSRNRLCRVDTRGGVQLYRQLSRQDCIRGRNWQVTTEGILVGGGCRAEFAVGSPYASSRSPYMGTDRYGRPIYDGRTSRYGSGYAIDRYGRRVYVGTGGAYGGTYGSYGGAYGGSYGSGGYDRYGDRIYTDGYGNGGYDYGYGDDGDRVWVQTGAGGYYTDRYGRRIYDDNRDATDEVYERNRDMGYPGAITTVPVTTMPSSLPSGAVYGESTIYCQSAASGRTYCGDRNVTYSLQKMNSNCALERTYGKDRNGTWVSGGCSIKLEPAGF
jgi:hypothetical protein